MRKKHPHLQIRLVREKIQGTPTTPSPCHETKNDKKGVTFVKVYIDRIIMSLVVWFWNIHYTTSFTLAWIISLCMCLVGKSHSIFLWYPASRRYLNKNIPRRLACSSLNMYSWYSSSPHGALFFFFLLYTMTAFFFFFYLISCMIRWSICSRVGIGTYWFKVVINLLVFM